MMNDLLANALAKIEMYENLGRKKVEISPVSNLMKNIFNIMNKKGYIGQTEIVDETRGETMEINLIGKVNKCGVIKPRTPFRVEELEKYEKRYLPARYFGVLFVSTSKGIMPHTEAKEKKIGGRLVAYCY